MNLLTPEEESLAREPASFAQLMGEREYEVRRLLIENRGLGGVYRRDASVYAVMQMYIGGHLTWQGALLLAYRQLIENKKAYQRELAKYALARDLGTDPPYTLETVNAGDIAVLSALCAILRGMVARAISAFGMPAITMRASDCSPDLLARIKERSGA